MFLKVNISNFKNKKNQPIFFNSFLKNITDYIIFLKIVYLSIFKKAKFI